MKSIVLISAGMMIAAVLVSKGFSRHVIRWNKRIAAACLFLSGIIFFCLIFIGCYMIWAEKSIVINEVCSDNFSVMADGEICDYVELYNPSKVPVSLKGYSLSDREDEKKYFFGDVVLGAESWLLVRMNGENETEDVGNLQAPFRISSKGEALSLYDASGEPLDYVEVPGLDYDTAYVRLEDGKEEWGHSFCTPGTGNRRDAQDAGILFSADSGFYEEPFYLELSHPEGRQIFYTLDGSRPDRNAILYTEPIYIEDISDQEDLYSDNPDMSNYFESVFAEKSDKAQVIRAISVDRDGNSSEVADAVYFVGYQDKAGCQGIPVISLIADPEDLFGEEEGIYVVGKDYKAGKEEAVVNYAQRGKEWEREIFLTYFDESHENLFSQACGIRIQGASKRNSSQKSLTIHTRYRYGEPFLKENIFGDLEKISKITLKGTLRYIPRDAFPYELVKERNIGVSAYQYSAVFINGEYWGLYVVKERFTAKYFEEHYGVDRDQVILLKESVLEEGMEGDEELYQEMMRFACENDMADQKNYEEIANLIDIQSFIDYFCTQVYICNMDFAEWHNCYTWRSREKGDGKYEDGKWRWLLYDIDYSAGTDQITSYETNTFRDSMPYSPYTAEEDRLFQALMANEDFREQFVITFMDLANTCFETEYVTERIDTWAQLLEEPMKSSIDRFEQEGFTVELMDLDSMREFYANRFPYAAAYLAEVFELTGDLAWVRLECSDVKGGSLQLNTVWPDLGGGAWEGQYFTDYPITVTAIPEEGYRFAGWNGDFSSDQETVAIKVPEQGLRLLAVFEKTEE